MCGVTAWEIWGRKNTGTRDAHRFLRIRTWGTSPGGLAHLYVHCKGGNDEVGGHGWKIGTQAALVPPLQNPAKVSQPPRSPVAYAVVILASFFMTLFLLLLGHHCHACGLRMRTRNLCCGLSQPGFETGLAESCVIARNQCFLTDFRSRVTGVWISDDFAGIFERCQTSPYKFIHAKLFRASNFDNAVYRRAYRDSSHCTRDIVRGHRLEKHMRQMHSPVDHGNVSKALEELEELCRMHDGVGD